MGNVYQSLGDISFRFHQNNPQDFNYMVQAVGFGIRYRTPVGPVRVDFAYSINPPAYVGVFGHAVSVTELQSEHAAIAVAGLLPNPRLRA